MASKKLILTLTCVTALAILAAGCGSDDDSSPAAPIVDDQVDTAPPALPSNLQAAYDRASHSCVISWDDNVTDADFVGFLVSRARAGSEPVELVAEPITSTQYEDSEAGELVGEYTYLIRSVDTSGNLSSASTVVVDLTAPAGTHSERVIY
jgi:predicted phage tail protein